MSNDNTRDAGEPSLASAGSHGLPVAWALMQPDSYSVFASRALAEKKRVLCFGGDIVPLYRQPQPTLTDEEREAIAWAINKTAQSYDDAEGGPIKREAMRGLLQRTK